MPVYEYKKMFVRSDGRVMVKLMSGIWHYRNRANYCNKYNLSLDDIYGMTIHHVDNCVINDSPENLEMLTRSNHMKLYHSSNGSGKRSKKICKKFSIIQKKLWNQGKYKNRKKKGRNVTNKYSQIAIKIIELYNIGFNGYKIAKKYNIPVRSVYNIIKRGY